MSKSIFQHIPTALMVGFAIQVSFSARTPNLASPSLALPLTALDPGLAVFVKAFKATDGLGPDFNAVSCVSCHDTPVVGGSGGAKQQFVEWTYGDTLDKLGAPRQRFVSDSSGRVTSNPPITNSRRRPPALFGLGYLEAIAVEQLRSRSDPFDADRDGISGRLPWRDDCYGRFGWQSSVCDVQTFVTGALSRELGIETLPRSRRELSENDLADLVAYVRNVPLPSHVNSEDGADLFHRVQCSKCHAPMTGVAMIAGERTEVKAYTDLLVHEMGAGPRHLDKDSRTEFRTPPLWRVASTGPPYLHDGSAARLEEAILLHGGEAERSRRLFSRLSRTDRRRLLRFVSTR